jgi:hypothetical protein
MLPIVLIIFFIALIVFLVFAARKKSKGEDLGEEGRTLNR